MADEKRYIVVQETARSCEVDSNALLQLVTRKKLPGMRARAKRRHRRISVRQRNEPILDGVVSRPAPDEVILSLQISSNRFWTACAAVSLAREKQMDGKVFFDAIDAPEV